MSALEAYENEVKIQETADWVDRFQLCAEPRATQPCPAVPTLNNDRWLCDDIVTDTPWN